MTTMPKKLLQITPELVTVLDQLKDEFNSPLNPLIEKFLWEHPSVHEKGVMLGYITEDGPPQRPSAGGYRRKEKGETISGKPTKTF